MVSFSSVGLYAAVVWCSLCGLTAFVNSQNLAPGVWSKSHADLRNSAWHPVARGLKSLANTRLQKYNTTVYGGMEYGSVAFDTVGTAYYASFKGYHRLSTNGTLDSEWVNSTAQFFSGTSVTEDGKAVYVEELSLAIKDWQEDTSAVFAAWEETDWLLYGAGTAIVDGNIFVLDGHANLRQIGLDGTFIVNAGVAFAEDSYARNEFATAATTGNGIFYYCTSWTSNTTVYAIKMPQATVLWKYDTQQQSPLENYDKNYYCSSSMMISRDRATVYMITDFGALFAFDAATGQEKWVFNGNCLASWQVPIEAPDGSIVLSCHPKINGRLHIFGIQNGQVVHNTSFPTEYYPDGSAAVSADGIMYGSIWKQIFGFDLNSWTLLWSYHDEDVYTALTAFSIGNDGSIWTPNTRASELQLLSLSCNPGFYIGDNGVCTICPSGTSPSPTGCTFYCGTQELPYHILATCDICQSDHYWDWTLFECRPFECSPPCWHGFCGANNTCHCNDSGWSGDLCDSAICDPPCLNGGQCIAPAICNCNETLYTGSICSEGAEEFESSDSQVTTAFPTGVVVGVILGGCVLFAVAVIVLLFFRRRKRSKSNEADLKNSLELQPAPVPANTHYESIRASNVYTSIPFKAEQDSFNLEGVSWAIPTNEVEIQNEIGRGAFGIVYRGRWRNLDVAVKRIIGADITQEQKSEFVQECKIMMNLRPHANVIQLMGIIGNPFCIVTTFYSEGSLDQLLRSSSKALNDLKTCVGIVIGIASGMDHLHKEKVIHRDLAARNVLLGDRMNPVVSDFGQSRINAGGNSAQTKSDIGPIKWMAPESLSHRVYSTKTDVWSFGVTCWEIIARSNPFPEMDPMQAAFAIRDGIRLRIPEGTPTELGELIEMCWRDNPEERTSMDSLVTSLITIQQHM